MNSVKFSILHGNEQLFASKYRLYLPTEEELRAEIETQKEMFKLQQEEKKDEVIMGIAGGNGLEYVNVKNIVRCLELILTKII